MEKHSISITWMATVRLAADMATLDVSWTNYFTECKSKGESLSVSVSDCIRVRNNVMLCDFMER